MGKEGDFVTLRALDVLSRELANKVGCFRDFISKAVSRARKMPMSSQLMGAVGPLSRNPENCPPFKHSIKGAVDQRRLTSGAGGLTWSWKSPGGKLSRVCNLQGLESLAGHPGA